MSDTDQQLLAHYARHHAEDAFAELVRRHLDFVHSAALRQVRSPQLAEEVAQSVFIDLSQNVHKLKADTILTAWLYQVTRRTAVDVVRREARRQLREQIATEMNATNATASDWTQIEPLLDEAMDALDGTDRAAVLLRFFENKSLRDVGQQLGVSDDAAQKRVSRAVERLREFFAKRGVTVGASGLVAALSANAIQAAPAGLAAAISTAATISGTTFVTTSAATTTQAIAMTTLQKTLITTIIVAAVGTGVYETYEAAKLRNQVHSLRQQQEQQASLKEQIRQLQRERDTATNLLAAVVVDNANMKKDPGEVLKLRGEVSRLRQENATAASTSPLNKITANPETRKLMRDQQKLGMTAIYKELAQRLKLAPEQGDKFNDLLADGVMDNVDLITEVLREGKPGEEMNRLFTEQEALFLEKLQALIGPDGVSQYQDYTKNLASFLTSQQFKPMLTGEDAAKQEKSKQLYQVMQEETQTVLAAAGLPPDYQTVPILNFRNIASETLGEQNLKMLDNIYDRVAARAGSFLTPEELEKFREFRTTAINNNRMALTMNRKLMAPGSK